MDDNTISGDGDGRHEGGDLSADDPGLATGRCCRSYPFSPGGAFIYRVEQRWINACSGCCNPFHRVTSIALATPYSVDISATILFALCYFVIAKVYTAIH